MSFKHHPSIDVIRQCFRYEDGKLFWLERPKDHFATGWGWITFTTRFAGKEAGYVLKGRWQINFNGRYLYRYWIVWALHHGEWRTRLDHANRNPLDDRIENLRPATVSQNQANRSRQKNNTSGYKGVSWCKATKNWIAQIRVNRKQIRLGCFDDPAEAHEVYCYMAEEVFGEFACGGDT